MAWTAASQFEIRPDGAFANGCGFDPSFGGTDYSQSATPILTVTDAVGNGTTTITSVTGGFTSAMRGNGINVNSKLYQITAYTNSNTITVDQTTGTFTGKTANVGGAGGALGGVVASVLEPWEYQVVVPGHKMWVRNINTAGALTNYTSTNGLNTPVGGSQFNYVEVEGYNQTRGDGGIAVFANAPGIWTSGAYVSMKNLKVQGTFAAATILTGAAGQMIENCVFDASGHAGTYNCQDSGATFRRCYFISPPSGGGCNLRHTAGSSRFEDCHFVGAAGVLNISLESASTIPAFEDCIIDKGTYGIQLNHTNAAMRLLHSIIWGADTTGLFLNNDNNDQYSVVAHNIFGGNGTYDIAQVNDKTGNVGAQYWVNAAFRGNMFYTTGTRYHFMPAASDDIALTANPFVSSNTGNFILNTTVGGGALVMSTSWSSKFADGVNTATEYAGINQYIAPATVNNAAVAGVPPVIDEVQFPTGISEGATGGPSFSTVVIVAGNGQEQRVPIYTHGRYSWNAGTGLKSPSDMAAITAFWLARQGRSRGFRWKDWDDYVVTAQTLTPDGTPTIQLIKSYTSGLVTYNRVIYKPVAGSVTMMRGGSNYAAWTVDTTSGIISWTAIIQKSITAITKASSAVVTVGSGHGFVAGDVVYFAGVVGMTQINGLTGTVSATASTTITVNIDSTSFSTYTSSGTASKYPQPSDIITWSGQFDVPVRFDTDMMVMTQDSSQIRHWDSLPVVELTGG